jgi:hypothetical protein
MRIVWTMNTSGASVNSSPFYFERNFESCELVFGPSYQPAWQRRQGKKNGGPLLFAAKILFVQRKHL